MDEQQITVAGQRIAFAQSEGTERAVIFVHGNSSSSRTWGPVLAGLLASVGAGRFTDEIAIVADLQRPLAILQGEGEQLVSLDYLNKLAIPTLWRGAIQLISAAGHALHQEAPEAFAALLGQFIADLA